MDPRCGCVSLNASGCRSDRLTEFGRRIPESILPVELGFGLMESLKLTGSQLDSVVTQVTGVRV